MGAQASASVFCGTVLVVPAAILKAAMLSKVVVVLGLAALANAMELTPENWDAETSGKTVLIKFLAPW